MNDANMTLPGSTILELLQHWGTSPGCETPAFVCVNSNGSKQISRSDVLDLSSKFAAKLKNLGINKGDVVCNALPNSLERIVCEFGVICAGAVSMNGQIFRSDGEDFFESLRISQSKAIIVDPSKPTGARQLLLKHVPFGNENCVESDQFPHLQRLILCRRNNSNPAEDFLCSLHNVSLPKFVSANSQPTDVATIMTTSGTTGYSKLVKLTHANICHFGLQVKAIEHLRPGARFINCAPLGWAGGYPQWYLSMGVTRYFIDQHDGPVDNLPVKIWKVIVEEKIEYGFLSPMYVNAILSEESLWKDATWRPKTLCLAGQPVKQKQLQIIGRLCDSVDINYGATECNLITTHRIYDPSTYKDNCAGFPGCGVEIKIVNQQHDPLPPGQIGEVLLKSPSLCDGYMGNESASKKSFTEDGWFSTDDSGYVGPDGKLYLLGRQSDAIMRGAYILYPEWLEAKLRFLDGIKDVIVVGVPDPVLHNEICACVMVDGVDGVAVGNLNGRDKKDICQQDGSAASLLAGDDSNCVDDVDNISTSYKIDSSKFPQCPHSSQSKQACEEGQTKFDEIRQRNLHKPLTAPFNVTSVKQDHVNSLPNMLGTESSSKRIDIADVEKRLRLHACDVDVLPKTDAMTMVPKYYIFLENYPVTDTGKINRKRLAALATEVLHLE